MSPHIDVLRQHGLYNLADWAENPAIAPAYARQSAHWASVLCAPAMHEFAKWPCPGAREFQPEPEPPFGVAPAVFPFVPAVFVDIPAVLCLHEDKIPAQPTCTQTRPHGHFCLVVVLRPG